MVIYNYSIFDKVKRGDVIYIFEVAFAGEFELDHYEEDEEIPVLTGIIVATENGKKDGTLTGYKFETGDVIDPSKDDLDEVSFAEFEYFFKADVDTVDVKKIDLFNFIQIRDYIELDYKKAIIKSMD